MKKQNNNKRISSIIVSHVTTLTNQIRAETQKENCEELQTDVMGQKQSRISRKAEQWLLPTFMISAW